MSDQKAKFFAQYWGQKVMCSEVESKPFEVNENNLHRWIPECYLELTPLSQITDEDIDVIDMPYISIKDHLFNDIISQFEADYLRSKGYAVPWRDLSVDDLVKFGWVKLKDNE